MKRALSFLLVLMLLLSILPTAAFAEEPKDIIVYFTNDVHGAYENYAYAAEIMKDGDFIVDAGDNIQGSVAASLTNGQCMVDVMNAVGYDLAIPGNHEFDFGFDRFLEIANGENTPYISANVWDKVNDKPVFDAYKILEAGGKKIAFVGITTPETLRKSTPTFFQDAEGNWIYDFCNDMTGEKLYKVVQDAIDAAKAEGADYVIAIGHLGINEESQPWTSTEVIANVSGLDALIDGHSHSTFSKTELDKDGREVVVGQTGTKLANVGKMTIATDGTITAELIPVVAGEEIPYDATVAEAVAKIDGEVKELSETVVAKTEVDLTILDPDTGKRAVRNSETNLGDLCADAYRDFLKTDVAFVNGGGVRANIAAGDVTYGQIITVHPFGNKACVIEVTGEQLWQALEHGASAYPGESGGFLQVSGLEYTINKAIPTPVIKDEAGMFVGMRPGASHRVVDVKIGGEPLDPAKTYTLASHNYMLKESGDGYTMFKGCKVLQDEIALDNEVLIRYIRDTLEGVIAADSIYANPRGEGRIKVIENAEEFSVFFTNDVHGAYENYAYAAEIMKAGDFIVDAGDITQGSVAASLTDGQCMIDIMKAVGYDLAIPGNHDFDFGFDRFLEFVNDEGNTPYVSANVWDKVNDKAILPAYRIFEAGSKKIAFVGITTPETLVKSTPTFFQDEEGNWIYDFCNDTTGERLYKVVQDAVDAAKAEGADYVIAIGHLGIDEQSEPWTSTSVIANVSGLDALIDGHSHSTFTMTMTDKDGKEVAVAQTGTKLVNVGKMVFMADGTIASELIPVKAGEGIPYDETVAEAVAKIKEEVAAISDTVVAKTEVLLTTKNPEGTARAVRNAETNLGDLCADAYRSLLGTDIAFVNGGGVRADIAAGDVTYGQIIAVHPFGNLACAIEVTGQQIWEALELGAAAYPGESGGFLQVSGLEYTINKAIPSPVIKDETGMFVGLKEGAEHRVIDVKVGGEPLDVTKTYTLGGHNYMLKNCGDGYAMFKGCKVLQDEIAVDNEVLIRYIRDTLGGVVKADSIYANPEGAGRIKIVTIYPNPFTDVAEDAWYYNYVVEMAAKGVIKGMTDTTFDPEGNLTRAQAAVLLYRMAGSPEVEDLKSFDDVAETAWYAKEVAWAKAEGLVNGMTDTTFDPEGNLTRAQLVTILYRRAGSPEVEEKASFEDIPEGTWYTDAVAWAKAEGIVNGMTDTTFEPDGLCTRAQAAKILSLI